MTAFDWARMNTLWEARALSPLYDPNDAEADSPAIISVSSDGAPVVITRREFADQAGRYALALHNLGIMPEGNGEGKPLVLIAHTQNLESIYAFWGCLLLNLIPSMFPTLTEKLDPAHYMRNLAEVARVSHVRAVLTTDGFAPTLRETLPCELFSSAQIAAAQDPQRDGIRAHAHLRYLGRVSGDIIGPNSYDNRIYPDPMSIALLQHSSGTTGLQKGVALSHRAVLNQITSYARALKLRNDDVIASWLPLYHDMGLIAGFLLPLIAGIPLVLMSPFDWVAHPALLLRAIHDYRATLCWLPNFAYNHMALRVRQRDSEGLDLAHMRAFINCSEPVRASSHALFLERFAANGVRADQLAVSYAMAENTFAVTQTALGELARIEPIDRDALQRDLRAAPVAEDHPKAMAQVSCGRPIAGTQVKVVDADGALLPERRIGELLVKSDCMLTGYFRRPDLQPFDAGGWYKTGDRGYIAHGEVFVVGRSKDLLIIAGKNVYPQDIEALLYELDGIHPGRAVAFGVPDEREGTELLAVLAEVDSDNDGTRRGLQVAVRQHIARSSEVTVSYVTFVPRGWLIKTSSGKTARAANRDKWLAERAP
ncbi:MAG TPA: AMP-binding protein [Candidatus Limnocylindrales bacterium]|nr:AMP-binding protein [Candidatus Limnocylindrales bacterium]